MRHHTAATPEAMGVLGAGLAGGLRAAGAGCVVYLAGELGTGKTTLARGVLRALGHPGRVKSPTYALVESYPIAEGTRTLHHLDLYRLEGPAEVEALGLRDLDPGDWLLVEWPERGGGRLPPADLVIGLAYAGAGRTVTLEAPTPVGRQVVEGSGL